ncbi:hypothetical protein [Robertkochia solimangrovi]|uniref:hypothetical protein n=1 Tax=Robertkochia solimangrovi TaxID=2213046 RepID=UPI00117EE2EE|nr:hypothetical protein [Robertkochia solimangrovi]TRZ41818.1 hypothetical protein DMZ48_15850 [Robertkochia solimangrovi]
MSLASLPYQPHPLLSYIRVGKLLYYSMFLFILESWVFYRLLMRSLEKEQAWWIVTIWTICFLFSFVHIFLVLADGWSRYQNYKRAKDLFFEHGYRDKIARLYITSKCQRSAAIVAADELGIADQVKEYYKSQGVKWFHYVPYFMLNDPLFFFKNHFWSRTFLEGNYQAKYNYRKLQTSVHL